MIHEYNKIKIHKVNEAYIKIYGDISVEKDISTFFTFKVPGCEHTPKYKARMWDGNISLYNLRTKMLPIGLYKRLYDFCVENRIYIEFVESDEFSCVTPEVDVDLTDIKEFVDSLNLWSKIGPLAIREYQLDAIYKAIKERRTLLLSPTSSGKSLIIYCLIRWILEEDPDARVLLLVPTVGLVNQMFADFIEYSSQSDFSIQKNCQKLFSGLAKELSKRVLITTWQSFIKIAEDKNKARDILSLYSGVICDEAHTVIGKSLQSILEKCTHAQYRIGTTGTLDGEKTHEMVIEGFLGQTYKVTTTRELIDNKQVSDLKIKVLRLKYSEEDSKTVSVYDYPTEIQWLVANQRRLNFLQNVALATKGATLILVRNKDTHAKVLYENLKKLSTDRNVYYVSGSVDVDVREEIRQIANIEDCIIVATDKTMSTGVSIPNLRNVILGSPSKSTIQILQSIGRGLRLFDGKTHMNLIDICDDLRYKKHTNFAFKHALERLAIYSKQKFDVSIKDIKFY